MAGMTSVTVIGNLTKDPELRYTPGGTAVCNFTIAVNTKKNKQDKTVFIPVAMWGKSGEVVSEYMRKGKGICVVGEIEEDSWEDKETGQRKTRWKVNANKFSFLGKEADEKPSEEDKIVESADAGDIQF